MRSTADKWLEQIRSDAVREGYKRCLPLVRKFVIAELDCAAPSWRGIGRLCDSDPPPRLGARFRVQLEAPDAREKVGLAAEREILMGFLIRAAWSGEAPGDRDLDSLWAALLRQLATDRGKLEAGVQPLVDETGRLRTIILLRTQLTSVTGFAMTRAFEETDIIQGWTEERDMDQTYRAQSISEVLGKVGRMLHERSLDSTPETTKPIVIKLLEDYSEQRNRAQLRELVHGS